jgi:hypothetical protein
MSEKRRLASRRNSGVAFRSIPKPGCQFFDRQGSTPRCREIAASPCRKSRYVESLVAHPDFDPAFSEITDLGAVEHFDLQANDFLTLADQIDPFSLTAMRAFVVRTTAQNQVARMHKFLRPHRTIYIFESVAQAEEWLGL